MLYIRIAYIDLLTRWVATISDGFSVFDENHSKATDVIRTENCQKRRIDDEGLPTAPNENLYD
jgi:hypothetical protein